MVHPNPGFVHHILAERLCKMSRDSAPSQALTAPPIAKVDRVTQELHGVTLADDYAWMRDRESPEVLAYLEAENNHTEAAMAHTEELRETLYQEMVGRIQQTDLTVPARRGDYWYYTRTKEGQQYPIHCRKKGSLDAGEEVILDVNALAEGHEYFSLGDARSSPDHSLLVYSVDTDGSEEYRIRHKNLATGELLEDCIEGAAPSVEWGNDNRTLYYLRLDDQKRPATALRHILGNSAEDDETLFHEANPLFHVSLAKTLSRQYIVLGVMSSLSTEMQLLDANDAGTKPEVFQARRPEIEYYLDHHEESFYILTNEEAKNFRLLRASIHSRSRDDWEEVIPHREDVKLENVVTFRRHQVIVERRAGQERYVVRSFETGEERVITLPERLYSVYSGANPEFDSDTYRFVYTSMVTPSTVYDYHLDSGELEEKKRTEVLGGFDPEHYRSERLYARAPDGMAVPISLLSRKDHRRDGKSPCLLYAYGSYGASIDPTFSSSVLSLVDRGYVYAIAHIRGGGLLGEPWHDGGKMLTKRNTFSDFIAAAEHLIDQGFAAPDRLAIRGGSAGGMLMGAVVNLRPDLFRAAIAKVPFVDVLNTMLDETLPLTVTEFEEWGNPKEEEYFHYIRSYSPYDNVRPQDYPEMLITAGLNDPRVQYWEPSKWTAKLRATKTDAHRLLLKTNMGAGHGGASGRYDALRELAFEYAFLLDTLGQG